LTGVLDRSTTAEVVPGVLLRESRPEDGPAVRDFLGGLSLDSAYRRFFTGIGSPPTAALVRRLVQADPDRRTVVLAVAGAAVVGVADTTVVDGGRAVELGVVLADRWQRRGLGWQLCAAALAPALARGVPVLRAHTLPDNARVTRILRRRWPDGAPRFADGTLVWELPLRAENVLGA
jgi:RimJ/RimL family protein N-acetyltransferase